MKERLTSIGFTQNQADLMLKVKDCVKGHPNLDVYLAKDQSKIYKICQESGRFTTTELEFLKRTFRGSLTDSLIEKVMKKLKELLNL